jgi:hypothetical protein
MQLFNPPATPQEMGLDEFNEKFKAVDDWWRLHSSKDSNRKLYYRCRLGIQYADNIKRQTEDIPIQSDDHIIEPDEAHELLQTKKKRKLISPQVRIGKLEESLKINRSKLFSKKAKIAK